ncbi:hypothetical protein AXK11_00815 [Cephaloticoccus primus]|uniref:SpoVT-AbrB domain-containing protein n=1 Tax=Cephaloticoccus primus TaxID=1548207 RepID=A0A139SUI2_9BACT|nr:hypothetical protein [Cephaloticoccus primus]KXU38225.1 hypothetical protein AXK11_00815 [Cephaloticoccus primus]
MQTVARVLKVGDRQAVRLPSELKLKAKELVLETRKDGVILLYDPVQRERYEADRRKAFRELCELPPLPAGFELERP